MDNYAIRITNLTRDFKTVRAVDNLTMEVPSGRVFGFLGPNGAGKTTTLRLLLGLLEPTKGGAQVLGYDTRTQAGHIRQNSGALLEHTGLYERLSAYDNLQFYGRVWRMSSAERQTRIEELLNHLGLWKRRNEIVKTWSRGMKQKLAIARTLLHRPALVFFDEPTAGLDPVAAASLHEDIANLAALEEMTIFLTTHNMAEAEKLCHQVGIIREGKLVAIGPLHQLLTQASGGQIDITGRGFTPRVLDMLRRYPGISNIDQHNHHVSIHHEDSMPIAPLVNLLVSAGVESDEVRKSRASREETFLELVEDEV